MIVVVTGSRSWDDKERIRERLLELKPALVIQGGAPGADRLTKKVCEEEGIPCSTDRADWKRYGKAAGFIRNGHMLHSRKPDRVVAFWDEHSPGTKDCLDKAAEAGIYWEVNAPNNVWYDSETWCL